MTRVENLKKSTKWTDHTKGQRLQTTTWTDPTRVKNINKSTKWTDTIKGQDSSPQCGRTQQGSKTLKNPHNERTPQRVKTAIHNVDGPDKGKKLK